MYKQKVNRFNIFKLGRDERHDKNRFETLKSVIDDRDYEGKMNVSHKSR